MSTAVSTTVPSSFRLRYRFSRTLRQFSDRFRPVPDAEADAALFINFPPWNKNYKYKSMRGDLIDRPGIMHYIATYPTDLPK
jgi:hypothetical protein